MTKIETATEARAMIMENDADAIEEAADLWAIQQFGTDEYRTGVDENGDIWIDPETCLTCTQLVQFANWALENWR